MFNFQCKNPSGVSTISKSSGHEAISRWTPSDVSAFVSNIPGCEAYGAAFEEEAVDGEALMLLHQVLAIALASSCGMTQT